MGKRGCEPPGYFAGWFLVTHVSGAAITRSPAASFSIGALIGTLGGLIGLGGAEFRLPLLIGWFRFAALEAVILNKTMSLIVVASSLLFRSRSIPLTAVAEHWTVIANLLGGSLLGAWLAAGWATRMRSAVLYRVMAVLLVVIALAVDGDLKPRDSGERRGFTTGVPIVD